MTDLSDVAVSRGYVAPGTIVAFGRAGATTGYLACDGTAVSRATYSGIFAKIGVTFGPGDGSTTFNLPNSAGLFFRGAGSQTFAAKTFAGGAVGNKQADSTAINGLTAATTSTPSLSLSSVDLTHTHTYNDLTTTFTDTTDEAFEATPGSNSLRSPTNATEADTTLSALGSHNHAVTPSITGVVTTLSSTSTVVKPGSLTVAYFIKV
jgi:microcystin-dependent protein